MKTDLKHYRFVPEGLESQMYIHKYDKVKISCIRNRSQDYLSVKGITLSYKYLQTLELSLNFMQFYNFFKQLYSFWLAHTSPIQSLLNRKTHCTLLVQHQMLVENLVPKRDKYFLQEKNKAELKGDRWPEIQLQINCHLLKPTT